MAPDPTPLPHDSLAEWCDRRLAPVMFWLAAAFLVILGGVLHRLLPSDISRIETLLILGGLAVLWPFFILDAVLRCVLRSRAGAPRTARLVALAPALVPPLRLAATSYTGAPAVWLPGQGWQKIDHYLRHKLEQIWGVPMIVIALMVLPLLAVEYFVIPLSDHPEVAQVANADVPAENPVAEETVSDPAQHDREVRARQILFWVNVGNSLIWVAFATEFIIMVSVARHWLTYSARHWLDLAIVLLPFLDFMPLLRVARLGRLARVYRLRGVGMRAWRAVLVLNALQRLSGRSYESRIRHLRNQLAIKLEEVEVLRAEIAALEARLAAAGLTPKPEVPQPTSQLD